MKALTRQFALYKQTILTDTRSLGFQVLRFGFAVILALFFYFNQSVERSWRKIDGLYVFENLSIVNITFIYLASFCLFLPLIKEERDENTLGMILMTGVSPFAYLFGKIGSRVSMLVIMLSLQIPLPLIPLSR